MDRGRGREGRDERLGREVLETERRGELLEFGVVLDVLSDTRVIAT